MAKQPGSASLEKNILRNYGFKKKSIANIDSLVKKNQLKSQDYSTYRIENFDNIDNYNSFFTTQQFSHIDFSEFSNHTFFDSAEEKTRYSYDYIFNDYPYDKNIYKFKQYHNKMDGFTKYIYDTYIPKNKGYLNFDGQNEVYVQDFTQNLISDSNKKEFGLINLNRKKLSFEFWIYVNNTQSFGKQIVFQKIDDNNNGITCFLDNLRTDTNLNVSLCDLNILLKNEENYLHSKASIKIEEFSHINISFFDAKGNKLVKIYNNGERQKTITNSRYDINSVFNSTTLNSDFFIGNGKNHLIDISDISDVIKTSGLIGKLDEFRIFKESHSDIKIKENMHFNLYSNKNIILYYRFNEPGTEYLNNHIVIDYSGNKIFGKIRKNTEEYYTTSAISSFRENNTPSPLIYEEEKFNPVLFPRYSNILENQNILLKKGNEYDKINPNLIFRLFPKNLFYDVSNKEGNEDIFVSSKPVNYLENDSGISLLEIEKEENNVFVSLLLIWARFFDQFKFYIDQITEMVSLKYEDLNKDNMTSSLIISYAVKYMGFDLEEIFPNITEEKLNNRSLTFDKEVSSNSIRQIQNNLWKRFLINSQDYIQSKGTKKSIRSIFNNFGLDSNLFINIREFKSQNILNFSNNFKEKNSSLRCIDFFTKEISRKEIEYDQNTNIPSNRVLFENILYNNEELLANFSNDWAIELHVKYNNSKLVNYSKDQNIFRIDNDSANILPYISLNFSRNNINTDNGTITAYFNELNDNTKIKNISINDVNLLSGKVYYICINKKTINSDISEYSVIISESGIGSKLTSAYEEKITISEDNKNFNVLNPVLRIGPKNNYTTQSIQAYSNLDFNTNFEGQILGVRLWKQTLNNKEISLHKTDILNYSLINFTNNINFDNLVLNVTLKEDLSDLQNDIENNVLVLNNFVDNTTNTNIALNVPNVLLTSSFIKNIDYKILEQNSTIDYPDDYNLINIAGYESEKLTLDFQREYSGPIHEINQDFNYKNDNLNVSIDFSTCTFINKEISKLISVNEFYTKALSNRSNLYEENYQDLKVLNNHFYDKLEKEVNIKQMYQIYKYFDNILENLLKDTIPSKIKYQGFNFVYESDMSERHKYVYKNSHSRIGIQNSDINFSVYNSYNDLNLWKKSDVRSDLLNRHSANRDDNEYFSKGSW